MKMLKFLSALVFAIAVLIGLGALPSLSYATSDEEAKAADPLVVAMSHGDHDEDKDDDDDEDDDDGDDDDDDEDDE
jgi:phosphopantothenoylcysteine synthetase/decarboxylase